MDYFVWFHVAGLEFSVRFIRRRRQSFGDFSPVLRRNRNREWPKIRTKYSIRMWTKYSQNLVFVVAKTSFSVPPSCSGTEVPSESRLQQEKPGSIWISAERAAHEQNCLEFVRQRSADCAGVGAMVGIHFTTAALRCIKKLSGLFFPVSGLGDNS